jgi:hypothetical protein
VPTPASSDGTPEAQSTGSTRNSANLGRLISDYGGLLEAFRERAQELEISRKGIDEIAGWADGYAGKLLTGAAAKRRKIIGPLSLELMLGVLGLKILLIEDDAATARTIALRTPVSRNQRVLEMCAESRRRYCHIRMLRRLLLPGVCGLGHARARRIGRFGQQVLTS